MNSKSSDLSSLLLAILATLFVLGIGYLAQDEFVMFAYWFLFETGGFPMIIAFVAVVVLAVYVFWAGVFVHRPVVFAGLLLLPSIPIASIAGGAFVPMIDLALGFYFDHWSFQGALAALALGAVSLALPGLIFRLLGGHARHARWVWFPVMLAYGVTGIFLLQSYFEAAQKIACAVTCLMSIGLAWLGYLTDRDDRKAG